MEVKTARSKKFGDPLQWITKRKQRQLAALAGAYLAYGEEADAVRFDVVTVDMSRLPPAIMHMEDAFRPDGR